MAGRPQTTANRVGEFEVAGFELAQAVFEAIPEQYRDRPDPKDLIATAWYESVEAAVHFWTVVADLGDLLREKAGIEGRGPTDDWRLTRRGEAGFPGVPPRVPSR